MRALFIPIFAFISFCVSAQIAPKRKNTDFRQTSFNQDTTFIKDSIKTFKALVYLNFHFSSLPLEFVLKYSEQIDTQFLETKEAKDLKKQIALAGLSKKGLIVADFKVLTNTNDTLSLQTLTKKHKLILLDFWASWCSPCRENSHFLLDLYRKYNAKGFSILSISDDIDKSKWATAIDEDKIGLWYHGIENPNETIQAKFGVYAIPTFILLNDKMQILGKFNGRWKGQEDLEKAVVKYLKTNN